MKERIRQAKLRLLQMHYESGVGHIGGNLSSLDMMLTLHHRVLGAEDGFVLSKGHSAGALYVTLWSLGKLTDVDLTQFHRDDTRLSGHPPPKGVPDVAFATGSLGHGLSLASGLALGKRLRNEPGRIFCLMSDGEWNEGSSWEALVFAAHRKLDNLTVMIDLNGLQGFGSTEEVADLGDLGDKLRRFGVLVIEVDGHDPKALEAALKVRPGSMPTVIAARTVKGSGVSFMENKMEWHYLPLSAPEYAQAVKELSEPEYAQAAKELELA